MALRNRRVPMSIAALTLFGATACASILTQSQNYTPRVALLTVHNRGWEDVTLYVDRAGTSIPIGRVPGLSSRTIIVPAAVAGNGMAIQIRGRMRLSSEEFVSHVFDLMPGTDARLVIEQVASLSHVVLR